jgi:hypothetical protein
MTFKQIDDLRFEQFVITCRLEPNIGVEGIPLPIFIGVPAAFEWNKYVESEV